MKLYFSVFVGVLAVIAALCSFVDAFTPAEDGTYCLGCWGGPVPITYCSKTPCVFPSTQSYLFSAGCKSGICCKGFPPQATKTEPPTTTTPPSTTSAPSSTAAPA
ncbi:hypothetical protein Bhyg_13278 [Pseudolycoriella hygida]|uniref:Uncharacterized protein n=1 Tax=Pseudolycoriella hygida TaxID=35572 RepID=A0A9Q0MN18_9DIPT|nr:hypothetical protein Bhyg_13278 [Pseudolycoriella hygida]